MNPTHWKAWQLDMAGAALVAVLTLVGYRIILQPIKSERLVVTELRAELDQQQRMVCVLSALTDIGTDNALRNHIRGALNLGLTEQQINEIIFHQTFYIGVPKARRAKALAKEVFDAR